MGDFVSQARININYSGGNFQLRRVKSYDVNQQQDLEVLKAVGVEEGAGFRDSTGGYEITFEVYRETLNPEVNWRKLRKTKERFSLTFQDVGGTREQYQGVRVANVARKGDDSGSHMDTVKLLALARVDMPSPQTT